MILEAILEAAEAGLEVTFKSDEAGRPLLLVFVERDNGGNRFHVNGAVDIATGGYELEVASLIRQLTAQHKGH